MARLIWPLIIISFCFFCNNSYAMETIKLTEPEDTKEVNLKELLSERKTVRAFQNKAVPLDVLSYVLWSSYGFKKGGGRVVPSAGALYPLDIYVVMMQGVYHYLPDTHSLKLVKKGDLRNSIARASLSQMWMAQAPVMLIITVEYRRITGKYGDRGIRYALIEAGNVSQNIFLSTIYKGLGCGIVGAFHDDMVKDASGIEKTHEPLLIMPVGYSQQ
ncbi:MAG TPA: nitroreductase [Deltaproteobacteria bacterium]|nr:nitroreductase [Deltaproteobacteria bacterium]